MGGKKGKKIESTVAMDGFKAFKFVCALNRVNVLVETLDGIAAYSKEWMNITYRRSMRHIYTYYTLYSLTHLHVHRHVFVSYIHVYTVDFTVYASTYSSAAIFFPTESNSRELYSKEKKTPVVVSTDLSLDFCCCFW